jgi:hypothetical protein
MNTLKVTENSVNLLLKWTLMYIRIYLLRPEFRNIFRNEIFHVIAQFTTLGYFSTNWLVGLNLSIPFPTSKKKNFINRLFDHSVFTRIDPCIIFGSVLRPDGNHWFNVRCTDTVSIAASESWELNANGLCFGVNDAVRERETLHSQISRAEVSECTRFLLLWLTIRKRNCFPFT